MEFFTPFIDNVPANQRPEILEAISNTCRAIGDDDDGDSIGDEEEEEDDEAEPEGQLGSFAPSLDLDHQLCRRGTLEEIGRRAYALLRGSRVSVRIQNSVQYKFLSPQDAEAIVQSFFIDMLCSTPNRIRQIVSSVNLWNAAKNATNTARDDQAPLVLHRLYGDIAFLAIRTIQRNIRLVELSNHWASIRRNLAAMNEDGTAIRDYLALPAPSRGQTYVTLAKAELCARAGIQPAKFGGYLRDGYIPHGLFEVFGYGSLLLCPAHSGK